MRIPKSLNHNQPPVVAIFTLILPTMPSTLTRDSKRQKMIRPFSADCGSPHRTQPAKSAGHGSRQAYNQLTFPFLVVSKESFSMKCARLAIRISAVAAIVAALFSIGAAQNREKFGISAKAGGVNSVNGNVMVKREGQAPQLLTSRDDLFAGDVVTTGAAGQVEILLNPGSYFRAGENTEFILVSSSLDNLLLKLVRGSAIIEATGPDDAGLRINIATDQKRLVIVRAGIYRINAQTGTTELIVRKGRVMLGTGKDQMVKGGKRMTFSGGSTEVVKISKSDQDQFDNWSKERGQTLARANQRLSLRSFNRELFDSRWDLAFSAANSWGLWSWSAYSRCYTFVPFYYGWSSPYGHYYGSYYSFFPFSPGGGCCNGHFGSGNTIVGNPSQITTPGSS